MPDEPRAAEPAPLLETLIGRVPFFRGLERVNRARLVGALEEVVVPAGSVLVLEGSDADALYLLEAGEVSVTIRTPEGERNVGSLRGPSYFGEMGLLLGTRTATVQAASEVRAWRLSRQRFEQIVRQQPAIPLAVAATLAEQMDARARQYVGAPTVQREHRALTLEPPRAVRPRVWSVLGAALAVGVPAALWSLAPPDGLSAEGWRIVLVMLGAAIAWLFEPAPDFVIALAIPAAWGLTGLVTPAVAFAGFASPAWIMAVSALGLAAAMLRSGLLLRLSLLLLRAFPATHAGQLIALVASGAAVTPLLPSAVARVAAIAPLTQELAETLDYPPRSRARAGLLYAGLVGYGSFSAVFLSGLVLNFFLLDLLPAAERAHFGWYSWLTAAAPAGAVLLAGAFLTLLLVLRPEVAPRMDIEARRQQARVLGAVSRHEWITLAALGSLLAGLIAQPVLRVDPTWPPVAALIVLTAGGVVTRQTLRESIEWGILILLGVLLGTGGVLRQAGIDTWMAAALTPVAEAVGDPGRLLLLLGALVVAVRLVLPIVPAVLLLSIALVPIAPQLGLSAWPVGFIVLLAVFTWVNPRQSELCRLAQEITRGEMGTDAHGVAVGVAMVLTTLLAVALSIPYWRALGLVGP